MQSITLLCVGRLKEEFWKSACAEYAKRLTPFCRFSVEEVAEQRCPDNPSPAQIAAVMEAEGDRLLARLSPRPPGTRVIALCIEGTGLSSEAFADLVEGFGIQGIHRLVFVIGGSWGLSPRVKQAAHRRISLSAMTLPHQLARVVLCEQIYRAFQIVHEGKYHK